MKCTKRLHKVCLNSGFSCCNLFLFDYFCTRYSYLVLNEEGSPETSWWNNNGSIPGYIDFTNPEASDWYTSRIQNLMDTYELDTLKFDAGESSWSPQVKLILFVLDTKLVLNG